MRNPACALLFAIAAFFQFPTTTSAQIPDLSASWIRGGRIVFGPWDLTDEGKRRFEAYDFKKDDPAYQCIGASWTRIWLNPNVLVKITQANDHVRLQYEWMDIDRRVPLVDPTSRSPKRSNIDGMPALGHSAAWYDGDALVIDTIDVAPGYVSTMEEWAGMPQSPRMHAVERIRRSGDVLTIEITHTDPANYRKPLVVTIEYRRTNWDLMEYGCTPGGLTEVVWRNPHSRFRIDVKGEDGSAIEWLVEMGASNTMKRAGFPMERFVVGDQIVITGWPGRRDRTVLLRQTVLKDGTRLNPEMRP